MKLRKFMLPMLLSPLLLVLAVLSVHAFSGYYYVIPNSVPLRTCASPGCDTLLTAYQGERVEILERTATGWSRVRFVDRSGVGWISSDLLSYSPDRISRPMPTYYVKINSLILRDEPNPNSRALLTLHFNDPVEMLGVGASGWAQVRDLRSSVVGWVAPRYLSSSPLKYPKSPRRRAPRKAPPKEEAPEPPKAM
ncbi:MAG: SH3 domain-containing protein [Deltaproteobacteria bacterium]|nr:SH3 domain-containing protein [Deltaproteobacteria bacterium]MBI4795958.1 SH3 domain-containing protein [Deltaproteobacteria bacterium]